MTTNKHLGREITFDHIRYIPVKDGFKIYYISERTDILEEITIPAFVIDAWDEFINSINGKIPNEKEVEIFLHNTFLNKNEEQNPFS